MKLEAVLQDGLRAREHLDGHDLGFTDPMDASDIDHLAEVAIREKVDLHWTRIVRPLLNFGNHVETVVRLEYTFLKRCHVYLGE